MINAREAKPKVNVFYQQPHMPHPEYGVITQVGFVSNYFPENTIIHVLFFGESTPKACRARDLHWPPNYCSIDGGPEGQIYQS